MNAAGGSLPLLRNPKEVKQTLAVDDRRSQREGEKVMKQFIGTGIILVCCVSNARVLYARAQEELPFEILMEGVEVELLYSYSIDEGFLGAGAGFGDLVVSGANQDIVAVNPDFTT